MRLFLLLCLGALLLATAASTANYIKATLTATTTRPLVGEPWRYTITVKHQGMPLDAKARIQILRGRTVVACWKAGALVRCSGTRAGTWVAFKGQRSARIAWPAFPGTGKLEFRAIVVTGTRTLLLRAPVIVQPRP